MTTEQTIPQQILDMEHAAKQCGARVPDICIRARIARSTWANWKSGKFSPRLKTWNAAKLAFSAAIEASDLGTIKIVRGQ